MPRTHNGGYSHRGIHLAKHMVEALDRYINEKRRRKKSDVPMDALIATPYIVSKTP